MIKVDGKIIKKGYPTGTWCECEHCGKIRSVYETNYLLQKHVKLLNIKRPCKSLNYGDWDLSQTEYNNIVETLKKLYPKSYEQTICFKEFVRMTDII